MMTAHTYLTVDDMTCTLCGQKYKESVDNLRRHLLLHNIPDGVKPDSSQTPVIPIGQTVVPVMTDSSEMSFDLPEMNISNTDDSSRDLPADQNNESNCASDDIPDKESKNLGSHPDGKLKQSVIESGFVGFPGIPDSDSRDSDDTEDYSAPVPVDNKPVFPGMLTIEQVASLPDGTQ